jgi:hypothetical protein
VAHFSYLCPGCEIGVQLYPGDALWLSDCVILFESGAVLRGSYDGSGSVTGSAAPDDEMFTEVGWHAACWEKAASPPHPGSFAEDVFWAQYDDPYRGLSPIAIHLGSDAAKRLRIMPSAITTPDLYRTFADAIVNRSCVKQSA